MSKQRALDAINLKKTDRIPLWDWPDSPPLAERLFNYDVWQDTYRTGLDLWRWSGLDITPNISGDPVEWNFPLVRYYDEVEILDDPECLPYKTAYKKPVDKPYKSMYDFLGMTSRGAYWGVVPTMAISKYAFQSPEEVLRFNPLDVDTVTLEERIDFFHKFYKQKNERIGDDFLYIGWYYCTLFMWCVELFGWENFMMAAMSDPARFKEILQQFQQLTKRDITAICHVDDLPLIGCHDDLCTASGPVFSPDWYDENIFPLYEDIFKIIHDAGKKVFFVCDGNLMPLLPQLRSLNINGLACDHNNDFEKVLETFSGKLMFGGAIDPALIQNGTEKEIDARIKYVCETAKHEPGYFFSSAAINGTVDVDRALYFYERFHYHAKR